MPLITRNKMSSHQGDAPLCKSSGEKSQQFHFSPTVALLLCMGVSLGLALLHTQQQLVSYFIAREAGSTSSLQDANCNACADRASIHVVYTFT